MPNQSIPVPISVQEFLQAIFPDPQQQPFLANSKYKSLSDAISDLSPHKPAYYTIASVIGGGRKNENFLSLNILVLDDINTKAQKPPLDPSYIIETSPQNYQWGYILQHPITNINEAKTLTRLLSKSPYSDPGLTGVVRLVRLPFGINEKPDYDPTPHPHLIEWHPNKKYSYEQLTTLLKPKSNKTKQDSYTPPNDLYDGNRNTGLAALFGHYLATANSKAEAIVNLMVFNQKHTHPPLDTDDVQRIIDSISGREESKYSKYINNIYHVVKTNEWYDFIIDTACSKDSLNTSYLKQFPGTKDSPPKITNWLPHQDGFNECADYGWSPVPHNQEQRTLTDGNRLLLNTWRRFNIEPEPGPVQPWLDLLHHVVPEEDYAEALLWWIAFTVQQPQLKCNWQPVILGIEDAGKDSLFQPLAEILGTAFKSMGNNDIKGQWDDGLYQTKLVHISEAAGLHGDAIEFYKRITATESSDMMMLNIKGGKKVFQRNVCNVVVITNNLNAMSLSPNDRRAFVVRAPEPMTTEQKSTYHEGWRKCGGPQFLFDYLLKYDLSKFSPNTRPFKTTYFDEMLAITRSNEEIMLEELLEDYDIALPKLLSMVLPTDSRYSINNIANWLETNGWVRWDSGNPGRRIKAVPEGGGVRQTEDRGWYVKKSKVNLYQSPSDMYKETTRVRTLLTNLGDNRKY